MKKLSYLIVIGLITGLGSCTKFLDVKPEDSVQEEVLYSTEEGFQIHLNGIYIGLTDPNLYGGQLTMEMLDVLAQRYSVAAVSHRFTELAAYDYTNTKVTPKIKSVWNGLYREIANVNTLLEKADEHKDLFTGKNYELIKGEALGLRAFLHFDALRLFGPIYKIDSTDLKRIPYYTVKTAEQNPLLVAKEVVAKIIADLKEAESYLQNDPVITAGKAGGGTVFTTGRQLRMNYYAVKLLQARVYLYANRKEEALAAAKVVIEKQPLWFPFLNKDDLTSTLRPDRIFSSELVFALQNKEITDSYNNYFNPALVDNTILMPLQTRLDATYENASNDYRNFSQIWAVPGDGIKSTKCFYKYAPITDTITRKYSVPLMRVSEAYYIAAEASTIPVDKFQYLNTVRAARNLQPVATTVNFTTELTKEYQKEFYGEGQLFYYYKRTSTATIENGSAASGTINMTGETYILPLPISETSSRN